MNSNKPQHSDATTTETPPNTNLHIVVGLSGVGKTSVLTRAEELSDNPDLFTVVNYGDAMATTAIEQDLIDTRDELTDLPRDTFQTLQARAAAEIKTHSTTAEHILVDTHAALDTPFGYVPGLPHETITAFNPTSLIHIEAPPGFIRARRKNDTTRDRTIASTNSLAHYAEVARTMAITCCVLNGAYYVSIPNPDGFLDDAAQELLSTLNV